MTSPAAPLPYMLTRPSVQSLPLVLSSPHSGAYYTEDFLRGSLLDPGQIRSSEDAFVDQLFSAGPELGAPLLAARYPRAYLDLNRGADELDPAVVEGITRWAHNPRISSGLGVIPRVVAGGRHIYSGKMPRAEADRRIAEIWQPYHLMLRDLVDETYRGFGETLLLDCHSMPHEALEAQGRLRGAMPEVVLGDRFGAAASGRMTDLVEAAFQAAGLKVARNTPFAGAYITQTYGRPSRGVHVIQIEIDRALYMNEARIEPRPDFAEFQRLISECLTVIAKGLQSEQPLAAE